MGSKFLTALISVVLLVSALAVVACGDDDGGGGGGGGGDGGGGEVRVTPDDQGYISYQEKDLEEKLRTELPCNASPSAQEMTDYKVPKADEKYTIGLMEVTLAGHYYQAIAAGAKKAAQEAGVDLELVSSGQGYASPEVQIRQADQLAQKNVDAVVLAPSDIQGSVPIVRRFVQDDVPVINISTEVASPEAYMVMQDDYLMGKQSADQVVELLGENAGPGIIIAGPANATWSRKRAQGFKDQVKEKYPGVEVVASPTQNVDPALGLKSFENAVGQNPDIKWIYTVFNFLLDPGSLPTRYKDVAFVTNGLDPTSIPDLESGRISKIIGITPTPMGYAGVGEAVRLLNGEHIDALLCVPIPVYGKGDADSEIAKTLELVPPGFEG
jgi:ribose transport system substrate-binding protein